MDGHHTYMREEGNETGIKISSYESSPKLTSRSDGEGGKGNCWTHLACVDYHVRTDGRLSSEFDAVYWFILHFFAVCSRTPAALLRIPSNIYRPNVKCFSVVC